MDQALEGTEPGSLRASRSQGELVTYHSPSLISNSSYGLPLFLNHSRSKPHVHLSPGAQPWPQWSWCCICLFKNLNPGFPLCLFVPLCAGDGILTQVLPPRHPAVFPSSVYTTSTPRAVESSGFLYYFSGTFLISPVYPPLDTYPLPSHPPETVQMAAVFMQKHVIPTSSSLDENLIKI